MNVRTMLALALLGFGLEVAASQWMPAARVFQPLLIVAGLAALSGKSGLAISAALLTGALADGWSARWLGQNAFTHLVLAYPISLLARRFDLLEPAPAAIVLALLGPLAWSVEIGLCRFFDVPLQGGQGWLNWLSVSFVNALVGFAIYRVLRRREML